MFNSLSDRLQDTFERLRGKGRLTEDDINVAMREIRMALLEADVNYRVVKEFVARCKEKCLTADVLSSLSPAQNVVKVVLNELTVLLGLHGLAAHARAEPYAQRDHARGPAGLGQDDGCGQAAYLLKSQGHSPLLAACDTHRSRGPPTSSPRWAARSACRSSAVTARTPWPLPPAPSRRPSTASATS